MVDKDRYNMQKLPEGTTFSDIRAEMEKALIILQGSGQMTDEMKTAIHYVAKLLVNAEMDEFHRGFLQDPRAKK